MDSRIHSQPGYCKNKGRNSQWAEKLFKLCVCTRALLGTSQEWLLRCARNASFMRTITVMQRLEEQRVKKVAF